MCILNEKNIQVVTVKYTSAHRAKPTKYTGFSHTGHHSVAKILNKAHLLWRELPKAVRSPRLCHIASWVFLSLGKLVNEQPWAPLQEKEFWDTNSPTIPSGLMHLGAGGGTRFRVWPDSQ